MASSPTPGTSLPWQYRDDYTSEGFVTIIGNVDGEYVDGKPECTFDVVCRCEDEFGERLPNVAANVHYIVQACNNYPTLLATNAELVKALGSIKWKSADRDNMEFTALITYSQMDAIRNALATVQP